MQKKHFGSKNVAITEEVTDYKFSGICVNCALIKTCTFPNKGKNIQFCEEYR